MKAIITTHEAKETVLAKALSYLLKLSFDEPGISPTNQKLLGTARDNLANQLNENLVFLKRINQPQERQRK